VCKLLTPSVINNKIIIRQLTHFFTFILSYLQERTHISNLALLSVHRSSCTNKGKSRKKNLLAAALAVDRLLQMQHFLTFDQNGMGACADGFRSDHKFTSE
jgi:hypothetical protein